MAEAFDVIVIGAGPAGYPAAIRAAQNGLRVACVDAWKNRDGSSAFGGTCLNAGCIPSKALLESSELYYRARSEFAVHGIQAASIGLDLSVMQQRRARVVRTMSGGVASLLKAAGVDAMHGTGRLLSGRRVEVTTLDGSTRELSASHVVLATGFYDIPVLLDIPGEDLPKVTHYYKEPHFYAMQKVVVVGASNSSVDTATPISKYS